MMILTEADSEEIPPTQWSLRQNKHPVINTIRKLIIKLFQNIPTESPNLPKRDRWIGLNIIEIKITTTPSIAMSN